MKVYTKKGDTGETALIGGKRVPKDHLRIEAYGSVDELNSFIGLLRGEVPSYHNQQTLLDKIQNTLFVIGSNLASLPEAKMEIPSLQEVEIKELEDAIDKMEEGLEPLKNFVLPGGHKAVSLSHVARTICRRVERHCVTLHRDVEIHQDIIPYLNRLSDYFFVLSRKLAADFNVPEVIWKGIR